MIWHVCYLQEEVTIFWWMKPPKFLYKQSYDPDVTKDGCFDDAKKNKTKPQTPQKPAHIVTTKSNKNIYQNRILQE